MDDPIYGWSLFGWHSASIQHSRVLIYHIFSRRMQYLQNKNAFPKSISPYYASLGRRILFSRVRKVVSEMKRTIIYHKVWIKCKITQLLSWILNVTIYTTLLGSTIQWRVLLCYSGKNFLFYLSINTFICSIINICNSHIVGIISKANFKMGIGLPLFALKLCAD